METRHAHARQTGWFDHDGVRVVDGSLVRLLARRAILGRGMHYLLPVGRTGSLPEWCERVTLPTAAAAPVSPRSPTEVLLALSGLLSALFVTVIATTIVGSALPTIVAELDASPSILTWIVVSEILAMTVSIPLWGSCADVLDNKRLVQASILVFVVGSVVAATSIRWELLIVGRVLQGVGAGGLAALAQVVLARMVSPRELGRYQGYFGAVYTVSALSGPLLGGAIVSTPGLGWRWCFWSAVPVALSALVVIGRTLERVRPPSRVQVRIDLAGALLITISVCTLLVWVTLASNHFPWLSRTTALFALVFVVATGSALWVESRATAPVLPLGLFRDRTIVLATLACVPCGMAMFGSGVFLAQYLQQSRGATPFVSGLLTLPLIAGVLGSSTASGRWISNSGRWKRVLLVGSCLMPLSAAGLGTLALDPPLWLVCLMTFGFGSGVGLLMQNLVIVAQNVANPAQLGVTTSFVTFFRTLGGSIGVTVLGALLASRVKGLGADDVAVGGLPTAAREAYSDATGLCYAILAAASLVPLILVLLLEERPLREHSAAELIAGTHTPV